MEIRIESVDIDQITASDMLEQVQVCQRESIPFKLYHAFVDGDKHQVMELPNTIGVYSGGDTVWNEDIDNVADAVYAQYGIKRHSVQLDDIRAAFWKHILDIESVSVGLLHPLKDSIDLEISVYGNRDIHNHAIFTFDKNGHLDTVTFTYGRDNLQRIIWQFELAGAYGLKDVKEYIINRLVASIGC
jgi:hypothetical protein